MLASYGVKMNKIINWGHLEFGQDTATTMDIEFDSCQNAVARQEVADYRKTIFFSEKTTG